MAFQKLPDNKGMIYVPDAKARHRKNPCSDCFSCQWCSDERCDTCHPTSCSKVKKNETTCGKCNPPQQENNMTKSEKKSCA